MLMFNIYSGISELGLKAVGMQREMQGLIVAVGVIII